jgi:hypothetical protein
MVDNYHQQTTTGNWNALWQSFHSIIGLLRTPVDDGKSWGQFVPLVPARFKQFVKTCAQICTRNILAQVQLLSLDFPLVRLGEDAESQKYLDTVEQVELGVDELAQKIVESLNINILSPNDIA